MDNIKYPSADAAHAQHLFDSTRGDLILSNLDWFAATGQMSLTPEPDARQVAFYTGMQCEELAEKLEAIFGIGSKVVRYLQAHGEAMKRGDFDREVGEAMINEPKALLDGDIDLLWVSAGAGRSMGSDVAGAYTEVDRANWDKRFPDGTFHRNQDNGKVLKPEGWKQPELEAFIHPSLKR